MNGGKRVSSGKVFLVGAGPGDPGLLTLKGLKVLKKADVVIYDRLVSSKVLKLIPKRVKKIYLGKEIGKADLLQRKINRTMVSEARLGKRVVRLKGGDPFVFGRGGEELEYLKKYSIGFEVVPGVTSAFAAPAYAGIPVSHRGHSSSIAVVTGTEETGESTVDWKKIGSAVDTIVIMMGVSTLDKIIRGILSSGIDRKTRVAIIEWGTTEKQRVVYGTLENIWEKAVESKINAPAITVVGRVVRLGNKLKWFKGL